MRIHRSGKRMMRIAVLLAFALSLALPLTAHAQGSGTEAASAGTPDASDTWTFERGVTIVCPWGKGGGADSTIRPMARLLEEYLGVPVEVRNETGGSGEVVPLLLFCEHRVLILPDCECTGELGIDSYAGPWRAIFAKEGTPRGAVDAIVEAVEACRRDATWRGFVMNAAYDQREIPEPGEETRQFCLDEYKEIRDYLLSQGRLEKDYDDLK